MFTFSAACLEHLPVKPAGRPGGCRDRVAIPAGFLRFSMAWKELRGGCCRPHVLGAFLLSTLGFLAPSVGQAQGKLEARYTATLAGVPIGKGAWTVEIRDRHYSAAAEGRVVGLMRVITRGDGTASAEGAIAAGRLVPAAYAAHTAYDRRNSEVRMTLSSGTVTDLVAEPVPPSPDRVLLTEAHRHGVVDPMSAALIGLPGEGEILSPDVCRRTLPIFDGYQRFDLVLAFKRMEEARTQTGYQGPTVVCSVTYRPIAGHRPARYAIQYLMEQRDMEIAFAPIAGTRVLAAFRMYVPTLIGPAVLQATQFVTAVSGSRVDLRLPDTSTH
jgi:hypothetical protein